MALILIRADASPAKGTGHIMRCLALAEALRAQGDHVAFVTAEITPSLADRLAADGWGHYIVTGDGPAAMLELSNRLKADALVVDSYWLDTDWRAAVRPGFRAVLALDDLADRPLHADLVWNPSPLAHTLPYDRLAPGAGLLFGDAYLLLRQEIARAALGPRLPLADRDSILLTFGGSDPAGLTVPVVKRLAPALPAGMHLDVVAGGSNPALDCIRAACARFPDQVRLHVDSRRMGELMAGAGLAVTAGGGTVGELATLAVPTLLVVVADNQAPAADDARAKGWAAVVDARGHRMAADSIVERTLSLWSDLCTRTTLSHRISAGGIDGRGAERVSAALRNLLT
ncbi:UDP-2,4-diacetamido-2,4,6-trideoxy-beta-L-altropyranose hydrolase [Niveispirillum cyanobacteriorum]|uniref:UDP-2,4-diacetamido-2,4, 6-trideoxy-beta-L-altropyranose hydrolase n=1 Tax=Niveispirillum cyanobacteriorum TaxID=1612173 RepID=A0A2K9NGL7_9PROT|nr:UDP-2,4-diacetamido-2,4,6-trideoxy-beta-L-altropyranose hydrolase [Niveispirillum cyanobacteriorum]AUN32248.1 UDP-2,4-diacetamido-2,4,6-trideoxy-beta-L-altropyranose hydrolase [Niveispirillum cyanobacteriorum]GGE75610.1 UDP-2,4-diacetamido-2,4,6-trideoxy-beta-L-altropyranose hydrolase [Niveispirillum cyanobacteriorum]